MSLTPISTSPNTKARIRSPREAYKGEAGRICHQRVLFIFGLSHGHCSCRSRRRARRVSVPKLYTRHQVRSSQWANSAGSFEQSLPITCRLHGPRASDNLELLGHPRFREEKAKVENCRSWIPRRVEELAHEVQFPDWRYERRESQDAGRCVLGCHARLLSEKRSV
jgi:hypothetical protein